MEGLRISATGGVEGSTLHKAHSLAGGVEEISFTKSILLREVWRAMPSTKSSYPTAGSSTPYQVGNAKNEPTLNTVNGIPDPLRGGWHLQMLHTEG